MSSLVTIRYGPYESCGVVHHKTFRLEGLQAVLRDCGYVCVLEEAPDWNQVELVVHGESVYQCDINKLEFGGDGRLDPLCQEALEAVRTAHQQHQI
ncbi:hypothetical protein PHYPO_G00178690 [Pangasianodon hypophthalmus]|uniref:Uncharacterized protein n=1 Tax=Pangasianodon hypophthalmus TaxID=310915 RepID=A0A5N5PPY7_PANHP|nr:hypothetical protein PHYPO_G00178690 [Pangasianodon hypophthalmus]